MANTASNPVTPARATGTSPASSAYSGGRSAFYLVVIMLATLFLLAAGLLVLPAVYNTNDKLLEYCKYALSVLLGAFGAWIGAGAAYFFGKENLAESSRSTEAALRIQQETLTGTSRKQRIKDITLTALNKDFIFGPTVQKADVVKGLEAHPDYWWVPVLDPAGEGILKDVIHARVFWTPGFADADKVSDIISRLDTDQALKSLKPLHGAAFFTTVSLNDMLTDTSAAMSKSGAVVGIVVDDKGKPTYCFTKQDLVNAQS